MIQHSFIKWLPLVAASLLLGACASTGTHNNATSAEASHDVLKQRAQQRWDYLINKHPDQAYDYLTPGYRNTVTRAQYVADMSNRPVHWETAAINKVECAQAESCTVYVILTYKVRLPGAGGAQAHGFSPIKEKWLFLRKKWYHLAGEEGANGLKAEN